MGISCAARRTTRKVEIPNINLDISSLYRSISCCLSQSAGPSEMTYIMSTQCTSNGMPKLGHGKRGAWDVMSSVQRCVCVGGSIMIL